jgi:hypothetical protein
LVDMIFAGILLMAGTATVCGLLIADNLSGAPSITPHLLGHALPSVNAAAVFCAGLSLALAFCLGAWLIAARVRRKHRDPEWSDPIDDFLPGQWGSS